MKRIKLLKECKPAIQVIQSWFYTVYSILIYPQDAVIFSINTVNEVLHPLRASVTEWATYEQYHPKDFFTVPISDVNIPKYKEGLKRLSNLNYPVSAVISAAVMLRSISLPYEDKPLAEKITKVFDSRSRYAKASKYVNPFLASRINWEGLSDFFDKAISNEDGTVGVGIEQWAHVID